LLEAIARERMFDGPERHGKKSQKKLTGSTSTITRTEFGSFMRASQARR
jgi:hypothetical protein